MLSIRQYFLKGYQFLLTIGTTIDQDGNKTKHPSRWAQCNDKGHN
jgi:hypothetical protein